ncbi:hypothetical protein U9M48_040955 [Paspalum notatum var. saurae]|uniref:Uncharacterized protein n=1 Tax=Paspalum notatum var. saurae TaxID=547442 RepID=A0AAQ3XEB5_PASNO
MEGHNKVVLAFVLAVLMAGQLVAEAVVVREAHDGTPPIVDGARLPVPAARGPRKSALLLPPVFIVHIHIVFTVSHVSFTIFFTASTDFNSEGTPRRISASAIRSSLRSTLSLSTASHSRNTSKLICMTRDHSW